ncbi:MAG: polysaccharide biosynthesis/export family protein [Planctomycetota bacterium]
MVVIAGRCPERFRGRSRGRLRGYFTGGLLTLGVLVLGGLALQGCARSQDSRAAQIVNQRGFGRKFVGDSNELYYLGIGDALGVIDPLNPELSGRYIVGPDGTINVMNIGEVFVGGMTVADVTELLNKRYRVIITSADVHVAVLGTASKNYYVKGEVARAGKHPFRGDTTLFDVMITSGPTVLANEHKVRLIRADPVHPFVMEFDYADMVTRGVSGNNVLVRENDIIYVPPNFLGRIVKVLQALTIPFGTIVSNLLNLANLQYMTESFADEDRFIYGGYRGLGGYGYRGVGGIGLYGLSPAGIRSTSGSPRLPEERLYEEIVSPTPDVRRAASVPAAD